MTTTARLLLRTTALALLLLPPAGAAAASCGDPATPIARIQGTGDHSPMAGQTVTVEAVMSQDSRQKGGFRGFYLQQADHQTDSDPRTSEALFVYTRRSTGAIGDRLRITGTVKEFHGLTELVGIKAITRCGREPIPAPVALNLPWPQHPETLENMRVRFEQPLTVIDSHNLARYGELTLARTDQVNATEYLEPGPAAQQVTERQRLQRVVLDDGHRQQQPRPVPWPPGGLTGDNTVRAGDRFSQLVGVLDFRFGDWRLQPQPTPELLPANPRQPPPARPEQPHLRLVTLNLANYFNGNGEGQGFPTSRGARSQTAYEHQHQRLLAALRAPDPDILALTELENDGYGATSSVAELAEALGPSWRVVTTPGVDGQDEIRTALLYRSDRVQTSGRAERLNTGLFRHRGRPPVTQVFRAKAGDAGVRIIALHLKSKSCRGATGADQDQRDGQGCYNDRRVRAAQAIVQWLSELPTPDHLAGTLITGDLNAYARETPLEVFRSAGFASMVHQLQPCDASTCPHYTYRYKGARGSLDYTLASGPLQPRILTAATWLLNADEPRALAYDGPLDIKSALPWRSSDHNPVITDIRL
ncbi:ExeM/NucH family extracellular endonuclease [Marinobacter similis]|uniref:Endonuclease n=1 Tax=Marinobacter similis TaxID=1420916 RepID=W5YPT0_9GAMM|nr:ExeM/NucH family extracellular endonuclease [Marinobacter similis]AHI28473.1 endonuclease [Marinobacter similis]